MRLLAAALACLSVTFPAHADILIDNVSGLTIGEDGKAATFSAVLIGDDGRFEQVFGRKDKRPAKVDYRLDGKGRTMIPGLIDNGAHVMDLGLALLKAKAGFKGDPVGEPRPEDRDLAFVEAQKALIARGVTTVADIGTTIEDWQTYRRAGDLGRLQMRVVAYAATVKEMSLIGGPGPTPWLYGDRLKQNGVAIAVTPQSAGQKARSDIQLRNLMSRGAIDNFQVALTVRDAPGLTTALNALEELTLTYKDKRRWRIEGIGSIAPADLPRLRTLDVFTAVQPASAALTPTDGAALTAPWRSMLASGIPVSFGSGSSVTPPQPFADMALAISRPAAAPPAPVAMGEPQAPALPEAITRQQALAAWTEAGAQALFTEGWLGRIAKGARADFLFIDRDILTASPGELRQARVLQTWIGGQKVFDAQDSGVGKAAIESFQGR